jgi:hypothetical protein
MKCRPFEARNNNTGAESAKTHAGVVEVSP